MVSSEVSAAVKVAVGEPEPAVCVFDIQRQVWRRTHRHRISRTGFPCCPRNDRDVIDTFDNQTVTWRQEAVYVVITKCANRRITAYVGL
jgi:hypothetical protein